MSNPIVVVNVNVLRAPTPSMLQKTGALISQGGTSLAAGTRALLTQPSDLTPLLIGALTLASLTSSGLTATGTLEGTSSDIASGTYNATTGLVTLTLSSALSAEPGASIVVSGLTGTGAFASADGTWVAGAGTGGETVTYTIATSLAMTITGGTCEDSIGLANGQTFLTTIAGAQPSTYNGTFLATVTGATTFTYTLPATTTSPATGTPTYTPPSAGELLEMATTFFAQGSSQAVYVLELGAGTPAQGVTALSAYITANPGIFYSYLVPRSWDAVSSFVTLLGTLTSTTARTYFFITTTLANYAVYASLKSAIWLIEAPGIQATEFSIASLFYVTLNYAPSPTNRITNLNLAFVFGVTAYPPAGNSALLNTILAADGNYIGTGAAGGISNAIVMGGQTADGNPYRYWYSIDWVQINVQLNVTNALINGSNNPSNPIDFNQPGINSLQQVAASTMATGIASGIVLNPLKSLGLTAATWQAALDAETYAGLTVVNADPFGDFVTLNPDDYEEGLYTGFSILYTPLLGFSNVVFNVTVSGFAA